MPTTPHTQTHVMTGTPNGFVIDLGGWYNRVRVTARGECQLLKQLQVPGSAAPATPSATLIPAVDVSKSDLVHLLANDTDTFDPDPLHLLKYRYVPVWEPAAGANAEIILECT
jgi:hypothetical protein